MYTYKILEKNFSDGVYTCDFLLNWYQHTVPLHITSTLGEILDEDINIYIQENIDDIRMNLYKFEKTFDYGNIAKRININKRYFDELNNEIITINLDGLTE